MKSMAFSRRHLIQGLGIAGACSALGVERLLAQTPEAPVRVLLVALQHGWGISGNSNRSMSGTEADFSFPAGLEPFEAVKQHSVVVDGLLTLGHWGNNHDLSYADILTAGVPLGEKASSFDGHMPLSTTPSLDFLLQKQSGKPTFRMSAGYRSWGVKYHPLCFDDAGSILPFFTKATDAHQALFANLPAEPGAAPSLQSLHESQLLRSIFKSIKEPAERKMLTLGADEQQKLERYLSAVSELESQNSQGVSFGGTATLAHVPTADQKSLADLPDYLDMIRVGFTNDMTTSAVLGIGDIHDLADFHETHAHKNSDTYWRTRQDFAEHIAKFVSDLSQTIDVDGKSVLDNTVIILTGEVGDGSHDVLNKGHILFGGGGGAIETGRYLKQALIQGAAGIEGLRREDRNGVLQKQFGFGNQNTAQAGSRTNADLLRDVGNIAGLSLTEFGLPSQNKGTVI